MEILMPDCIETGPTHLFLSLPFYLNTMTAILQTFQTDFIERVGTVFFISNFIFKDSVDKNWLLVSAMI